MLGNEHRTKKFPVFTEDQVNRFWSKVSITAQSDKCWVWNGNKHRGYGKFSITHTKNSIASRVAYYLHTNADPFGKIVCHSCDNPSCCNPNHLFLGTSKENTKDMIQKGRHRCAYGVNHGKAKLSEDDIISIRNKVVNGESQTDVAKYYSIYQSVVSRIMSGKAWATVTNKKQVQ